MDVVQSTAFAAASGIILLLVSLAFERLATGPGTHRGNVAQSLRGGGHLIGAFLITASVVSGCPRGERLVDDVLWTAIFGVIDVGLLTLASMLGTRLIVGSGLMKAIDRGNAAAGLAAAAHYAATGVIIASCLNGNDSSTLGVSLLFFAVAQLTLHLFVVLFRAITRYRDSEEIHDENLAAGLSYAGITLALGMIIGHAADGAFVSWETSLRAYGVALLAALALYPVRQILVGMLLVRGGFALRGGALDEGIARGRNLGFAVLEASAYVATAAFVTRLVV
jgi:uncharacterized membrane protein YjfL (UPF0719 family)